MEVQRSQGSPQYENMQISAVSLPYPGDKSEEDEELGSGEAKTYMGG